MQNSSGLSRLIGRINTASPRLRRVLWRLLYNKLASRFPQPDWTCMNYGYAALGPDPRTLVLQPADEPERFALQLYHQVTHQVPLEGKTLLEVGSGRGGGISFLTRARGLSRAVGVDYSAPAVTLCRRLHRLPGLTFEVGDAEALPFEAGAFDAVVNVESSHCYGSMGRFLSEVRRVLKPGGHFLWADLRLASELDVVRGQLGHAGMEVLQETTISLNVLRSMELISADRAERIRRTMPRLLQPAMADLAGIPGTRIHESIRSGAVRYLSCVLRKAE